MPHLRAAIFDVDGVLVDSPHEKAWRESLRELMQDEWRGIFKHATWSPEAFTPQVYQTQISGKPRMSGARAVLDYFNIAEDEGNSRVGEYADRKRDMVVRLIDAGEFTAYSDAIALRSRCQGSGAAHRSRVVVEEREHAPPQDQARHLRPGQRNLVAYGSTGPYVAGRLRRRRLGSRLRSRKAGPADVPHSRRLSSAIAPEDTVVVEDAAAGVQAAKAGRMAADRDRSLRRRSPATGGGRRHRRHHTRSDRPRRAGRGRTRPDDEVAKVSCGCHQLEVFVSSLTVRYPRPCAAPSFRRCSARGCRRDRDHRGVRPGRGLPHRLRRRPRPPRVRRRCTALRRLGRVAGVAAGRRRRRTDLHVERHVGRWRSTSRSICDWTASPRR